jgi:hypothetical protein
MEINSKQLRNALLCVVFFLLGCRQNRAAFDRVGVTGIERGTNVIFKASVDDAKTIEALLDCFPGWNAPTKEGKPTELPDPYAYVLVFSGKETNTEIKVHGPLPGLYPGLWRHPSGAHFYLEGKKPNEFHNIMVRLKEGSQANGATNRTSQPTDVRH